MSATAKFFKDCIELALWIQERDKRMMDLGPTIAPAIEWEAIVKKAKEITDAVEKGGPRRED
jgi:hypothetical protein